MSWRAVMQELGHLRMYAPDLRGYGNTERPPDGYDVVTLTDDVRALIEALELDRPVLVGHDWGGAMAWLFAHRHSALISRLVVVNCTHPRTLVRAILRVEDLQTFRVPWVPFFEIPWLPERLIASPLGRRLLKLSFTLREGQPGTMDVALVDELVARFRGASDVRPPIDYYRQMVLAQVEYYAALALSPLPGRRRSRLGDIYDTPITVPTTLVWGERDEALSAKVARQSERDAGCPVRWRPLPGVGHFVSLEAPEKLAREIDRVVPRRARDRTRAPAAAGSAGSRRRAHA